jgi:hypothetical protein
MSRERADGPHAKRSGLAAVLAVVVCLGAGSAIQTQSPSLTLNDKQYLETRGLNVLVFTSEYNGLFFDEKTAGLEIIQHGVRIATGGAVRLSPTPEQWDLIPKLVDRKADAATNTITATLRYEAYNFTTRMVVAPEGRGFTVTVFADAPIPAALAGRAGLNLEFVPSRYWERTYTVDGRPAIFPRYASGPTRALPPEQKIPQFEGHSTFELRGHPNYVEALPLAVGQTLVMAPEDPERRLTVRARSGDLQLLDGRSLAQNGWFVVRSILATGTTGKVAEWHVEPNTIPNWTRTPVIGHSQVGYHPAQPKRIVVELDANDTALPMASLIEIQPDGSQVEKRQARVEPWGRYLRYAYGVADFSAVTDPGLYVVRYGTQTTAAFPIAADVYERVWHPTLDVFFPVQMDHMFVNEGYRVWHGATATGWARRRTRRSSPASGSPAWPSAAGSTPATSTSRAARTPRRCPISWRSGRPSVRSATTRSSIRPGTSSTSTGRTASRTCCSRSSTGHWRSRHSTASSAGWSAASSTAGWIAITTWVTRRRKPTT